MRKGMRLLAILSATVLLIGGCGTQMYELTDDEEALITQYAAYAVEKHNIRQKDGMTSDQPKEEDTTKNEQQSTEQKPDPNDAQSSDALGAAENDASQYAEISMAKAVGYESALDITYKGYKLEDSYKEGNYFSVNAADGNTLLVMNFTIANPGSKSVKYDTSSLNDTFYGMFDGKNKIAEKVTFSNKELTSSTKTIKAGKKAGAIMFFELSKEQAAAITTESLLVEIDGTTYQVNLQK